MPQNALRVKMLSVMDVVEVMVMDMVDGDGYGFEIVTEWQAAMMSRRISRILSGKQQFQ